MCVDLPAGGEGGFLQGHLGWAIGAESYLFFYLQNLGLAGLLALGGLFLSRGGAFLRLAPALAIWLLAELVVFQPNVYDNNKLLYPAYAFLCCAAARWRLAGGWGCCAAAGPGPGLPRGWWRWPPSPRC